MGADLQKTIGGIRRAAKKHNKEHKLGLTDAEIDGKVGEEFRFLTTKDPSEAPVWARNARTVFKRVTSGMLTTKGSAIRSQQLDSPLSSHIHNMSQDTSFLAVSYTHLTLPTTPYV